MIKHVFDATGTKLLRREEATPVCGEDFCDSCGDCLVCCGEDPCYGPGGGDHYWVVYEDAEIDKAALA